jgi:hypothetical protein
VRQETERCIEAIITQTLLLPQIDEEAECPKDDAKGGSAERRLAAEEMVKQNRRRTRKRQLAERLSQLLKNDVITPSQYQSKLNTLLQNE